MTFFNKKEEILEIKLTSFGKHLLSCGKFKPAYYKFFDNDSTDASNNLFISLKFAFGYFSLNLLKENLIS